MWRSARQLRGYTVAGSDGPIGKLDDVYFEEAGWKVRYLVVKTGGWLLERLVLLAPDCAGPPDPGRRTLPVALSRQQVRDSPPVEAVLPVSRRSEIELAAYYGWPDYWIGDAAYAAGAVYVPTPGQEPAATGVTPPAEQTALRSARELAGYHLQAADGEIGHIEDFLIEDAGWVVRYLSVDTRNWLPGRRVLVAAEWIRRIDEAGLKVLTDLPRERIRSAPAYDPAAPLTRQQEARLYEHYGRRKYWE
jgi:uncharacterized protein YrrD